MPERTCVSLDASKAPVSVGQCSLLSAVSLDPATKKPVAIAPLKIESSEEQRLFDLGKKNYEAKKALSKVALRKVTPNDEESDLIHSMWLKQVEYLDPNKSIRKPDNVTYMDFTRSSSTQIMQPQYRNRHNSMIFVFFPSSIAPRKWLTGNREAFS